MPRRLTHHIRHNVVAYLALFFALTGTAVAAAPLMTGAKIQDGTINSDDIRDRGSTAYPGPSIQGKDVEADTLGGDEVLESSLGEVPSAARAGVRNREVVYQTPAPSSPTGNQVTASCPAGKVLVGGGSMLGGSTQGVNIKTSTVASVTGNAWYAYAEEDTPQDGNWTITAYAICVDG